MGRHLASFNGDGDVNRWFASAVMVAALCAVTLTAAATAQAHATLESSNPADRSVVAVLPDVVELIFTEVVGLPADVAVTDPNGASVEGGEVSVIDRTASRPIAVSDPQPGTYVIAYRVTSADGHPISGTVTFTLDAPSGPPSTTAPEPADSGVAATSSLPVGSIDTSTTVDHDSMSHTTPTTAVTTTTPGRVVAAPVAPLSTSGRGSGDSNPTVVVLLLIAAAGGVTAAGLAVRRAAHQAKADTEPSVA